MIRDVGGRCRADRAGDVDGPARSGGADQRRWCGWSVGWAAPVRAARCSRWWRRSWSAVSHIDHADRLRAGATQRVLPFRVMAPSTLGTFLRSFTFGHVRQLDAVIAETIRRAWSLGAGPGAKAMTIDVDSTVCEVHGHQKQGAAYGYTRVLGYHPMLATRADTGEVLHARLRKGSSQRGAQPVRRRAHRPGPPGRRHRRVDGARRLGVLVLRADRHAAPPRGALVDHGADQPQEIKARSTSSTRTTGPTIDYPDGGEAQVAETTYHRRAQASGWRPCGSWCAAPGSPTPPKPQLWPDWRHHAFITDLDVAGRRDGPVPPRPRHRRARHPRPQRRCRARALPVRAVLRQRRLARLRGARPQPHPLDRPPRRHPPRRSTHRDPHHPHPAARPARTTRESQRPTTSSASQPDGHGRQCSTALDRSAPCRCSV